MYPTAPPPASTRPPHLQVVFRGYHTSDKLQKLHERAVEKRTALKVQMESEQQMQDLTDSQLLNEQQRSIMREWGGCEGVDVCNLVLFVFCRAIATAGSREAQD